MMDVGNITYGTVFVPEVILQTVPGFACRGVGQNSAGQDTACAFDGPSLEDKGLFVAIKVQVEVKGWSVRHAAQRNRTWDWFIGKSYRLSFLATPP